MPQHQQSFHSDDWRKSPSPEPHEQQNSQESITAGPHVQQNHQQFHESSWRTTVSPEPPPKPAAPDTGYARHQPRVTNLGDPLLEVERRPDRIQAYHNIKDRPAHPRVPADTGKNRLLKNKAIGWCADVKRRGDKRSAGAIVGTLRLGEEEETGKLVLWRVPVAVYPGVDDDKLEVRLAVEVNQGQATYYDLNHMRAIGGRVEDSPRFQGPINHTTDLGVDVLMEEELVELLPWAKDIMKRIANAQEIWIKKEKWVKKLNRYFREKDGNGGFRFPEKVVWTGQGEDYFGDHC